MIKRMPTHSGDESHASCVVAGGFIYLAHHAGGGEDVASQTRATFESMKKTLSTVGATLDDMVQINLYLKRIEDFRVARDVFFEYFKTDAPARMTTSTDFIEATCLCQMDGVAYKPDVTAGDA